MKRYIRQIIPISKAKAATTASSGGVTLEAALMMPIFLMLVFFLILIIQTSAVSMALHGSLSQTARQAASAWYPISLGVDQARASELNQRIENWNDQWLDIGSTIRQVGQYLPSPVREWAEQAASTSFSLEQHAARLAFSQLIKQFADTRLLDISKMALVSVGLPDEQDRGNAFLTLEAEYELPFQVPFTGRKLKLRESARERVWIGGSPSLSRISEEGDGGAFDIAFVSLEPNPVKPGRKATLVLRTAPGTTIDLSIVYKSGLSQAKHLGRAVADASGLVSWTWHVSGRTTPGVWNWQVSNSEGAAWGQPFEVAGKQASE